MPCHDYHHYVYFYYRKFSYYFLLEKEVPVTILEKEAAPLEKQTFPKFEAIARNNFLANPEQAFFVDIVPQNPLSALVYRLEIFFDPQIINVEEVSAGSFFDHPQVLRHSIDNKKELLIFQLALVLLKKRQW